ncbi:acyl-CoA synthetase [Candidatus Poriferisocius sp.]|uniref:acyl-CoA synthetase n=1 Tax=Candidatus Poriferisocius sp. TaxID=3101276 RepID=UPI003B5CA665
MAETDALGFWRIAEADPSRLAVVDPDYQEITYGELAELTNRIVHGLRAAGLGVGDQVTTVLPNGIEQVAVSLAAYQGGFYLTTVNWHLAGPEIAYIVDDSETKAFVVHEDFADQAAKVLEECEVPAQGRFSVGAIDGFRPFSQMAGDQPATRPDDLTTGSFMFYTSGTTGRPKGVRRALPGTHPDETAASSGGLFMLLGIMPHQDNVHITQAPLYHTAVNIWTTTSLHMGHPAVLMGRWTAEGALERIDRYRVTQSHMVPTMFHRLLQLPDEVKARYDVSSLRRMIHAAAPCPVETKQKMLDWWGDCIWEYYAATEGGGTYIPPDEWRRYPGTVGRPWPGSEVIVVDADGNRLPPGASGTIYMKMPAGQTFEYYKDKDKTDKARLGDEFFTVGDVGYLNEDGYLFLNDRANDMIIVGGLNIYPAEIEGAMLQSPLVGDVAVFGVPNEDTGEEIKAVVEPAAGVAADDDTRAAIMGFLREQIAKQKWPRSIDFTDEMPRDPNGKLYKRRLRDPYWKGKTRAI